MRCTLSKFVGAKSRSERVKIRTEGRKIGRRDRASLGRSLHEANAGTEVPFSSIAKRAHLCHVNSINLFCPEALMKTLPRGNRGTNNAQPAARVRDVGQNSKPRRRYSSSNPADPIFPARSGSSEPRRSREKNDDATAKDPIRRNAASDFLSARILSRGITFAGRKRRRTRVRRKTE